MVCVPLIGTIFIKPVREPWKQEDEDVSVLDESFQVVVEEEIGTFYYQPEMLTGLLMYRVIPEDTVFSSSEDYIVREDAAYDPEQEYLKALAIVCRSNIAAAWEGEQCPELLLYEQMAFEADKFYRILQTLPEDSRRVKLNEIKRAVDATKGVVITRDGAVMTAPFLPLPRLTCLSQKLEAAMDFRSITPMSWRFQAWIFMPYSSTFTAISRSLLRIKR